MVRRLVCNLERSSAQHLRIGKWMALQRVDGVLSKARTRLEVLLLGPGMAVYATWASKAGSACKPWAHPRPDFAQAWDLWANAGFSRRPQPGLLCCG